MSSCDVHGFDVFFGNLYHLNAEDEPEHSRLSPRHRLSEEYEFKLRFVARRPPMHRDNRRKLQGKIHGSANGQAEL